MFSDENKCTSRKAVQFLIITPNQLSISIHACGLLGVTIMVTKRPSTVYHDYEFNCF